MTAALARSYQPRRKPWRYDSRYITGQVLQRGQLGMVLGAMGLDDFIGTIPRPVWWHVGPQLTEAQRRLHGLLGLSCVVMIRDRPDNYEIVFVDRWTGHWSHPSAGQNGLDLVSLGAWRWVDDEYAAARRLQRLLKLPRAHADD